MRALIISALALANLAHAASAADDAPLYLAAGYKALFTCSATFLSNRSADQIARLRVYWGGPVAQITSGNYDIVNPVTGVTRNLPVSYNIDSSRQNDTTSKMIHGVPALVAFASRLMTLQRGDLLFTGTPAGVGPIVPGDVAIGTVEKVGSLTIEV